MKKAAGRIVRDNDGEVSAKLPQLGTLKVGMKVRNGNGAEYPTSLDYFHCTGKYAEMFHKAYGEKPNSVGIIFVSDNISDVCNERFELRDKAGNLAGSGDGVNFKLWDEAKEQYVDFEVKTPEDKLHLSEFAKKFKTDKFNPKWAPILTLKFVIPRISNVFGIWKFETKAAASSIQNLRDTFDGVMNLANTVINIPFDLTVQKVQSQKPGKKVIYPVVTLIPNVSTDKLDEISNYLDSGHKVKDIKKLIANNSAPQLGSGAQPDTKQLDSGIKITTVKNEAEGGLFQNT